MAGRHFLVFFAVLIFGIPQMLYARSESDIEKTFQFIYVAHDPNVPVQRLTDCLQNYYDNAMSSESYMVVFYMSNDDKPYIVQLNTAEDNRDEFVNLINALQRENSHIVNPVYDLSRTVEIFNRMNFVNPVDGSITFGAVDWFFYVNSIFWRRGYNQDYISSLCFVMNVNRFDPSVFQIKFYYPNEDNIEVDGNLPFGPKNYCKVKYYGYPY